MRFLRASIVTLVALALAGCSPISVKTDRDPAASFGALHTYQWRPGPQQEADDPRFATPRFDRIVRETIDQILASKGYRLAAAGSTADFFVGYHAVVRRKTSGQTVDREYGYYGAGWFFRPQTRADDYEEGTLLIDIIQPSDMKLLWRGSGTGVVLQTSQAKHTERITEGIEKILAEFPPR